ncbi:MAG: hypothetical protein ACLQF1_05545 [Methyloceanibacter sp.]
MIRYWRMLLRLRRATLARAVLVVRKLDGRVLALPSPFGQLQLPEKQLDAWIPITTQVEEWSDRLLQENSTPSLVAVDGTPGPDGVTFLFSAIISSALAKGGDEVWLDPDVAALTLGGKYNRLLRLCVAGAP